MKIYVYFKEEYCSKSWERSVNSLLQDVLLNIKHSEANKPEKAQWPSSLIIIQRTHSRHREIFDLWFGIFLHNKEEYVTFYNRSTVSFALMGILLRMKLLLIECINIGFISWLVHILWSNTHFPLKRTLLLYYFVSYNLKLTSLPTLLWKWILWVSYQMLSNRNINLLLSFSATNQPICCDVVQRLHKLWFKVVSIPRSCYWAVITVIREMSHWLSYNFKEGMKLLGNGHFLEFQWKSIFYTNIYSDSNLVS